VCAPGRCTPSVFLLLLVLTRPRRPAGHCPHGVYGTTVTFIPGRISPGTPSPIPSTVPAIS
jgi:hypothetical protein